MNHLPEEGYLRLPQIIGNLHALKALLPRYAGQVKCIYIGPTGISMYAIFEAANRVESRTAPDAWK